MTRRKNRNVAVSKLSTGKRTKSAPKNPAATAKNGRLKKGSAHSESESRVCCRWCRLKTAGGLVFSEV